MNTPPPPGRLRAGPVLDKLFAVLARLATSAEVEGLTGVYVDVREVKDPSELARDDALADRLDTESRRMVGVG